MTTLFAPRVDRAYQIFLQEAPDLLHTLEDGLLNLQGHAEPSQLNTLMRAAHSIKGCAASMGLGTIESIAHQLEEVFRALYRYKKPIDAELKELLMLAFDALQMPLRQEIDQTESTTSSNLRTDWVSRSQPTFDRLKTILADEIAADHGELPSMSDLGIDLVQIIFSGDVAQGIQHLVQQIKQGTTDRAIAGELRAQADVFIGVGEMTNLPGFQHIAQAVITALNHHPNQGIALTKLAIQNFRSAYQSVIDGDRTIGGTPSDLLLAMARPKSAPTAKLDFTQPTVSIVNPMAQIAPQPLSLGEQESKDKIQTKIQTVHTLGIAAAAKPPEVNTPVLSNVLRVDRHRFDQLSAHVGNLITYENAAKLQQQQLDRILQNMNHRVQQFEKIQLSLQDLHNKEAAIPQSPNFPALPHANTPFSTHAVTQILSDPLQFDTYTPAQNLTQSATEELACLKEVLQDLTLLAQQQQQQQRKKFQTLRDTQNDLLWIRMLPIEQILQRFPRMVRDLCVKYNKDVTVELIGTSTLIDKAVLEKLFDPLVHLVRNAFDHGVESPLTRQSHGKSDPATIAIKAYHQGNLTYVEIRDNGNGIDLNRIRTKAIAMGLTTLEAANHLSDTNILEFIFEPGFSTAIQVSELSGRGVGLDSVRENLRCLKGEVCVFSEVGEGTMFRLTFPLTLTIADLLVFRTQNLLLSVPVDSLAGIVMIQPSEIETLEGRSFYRDEDELIEIADLAIFQRHYPLPFTIDTQLQTLALPNPESSPIVIIEHDNRLLALVVDQIIQRQEQVIKPFNTLVPIPDYLCGCTVLGNGTLVPVLDSRELIQAHRVFQAHLPIEHFPQRCPLTQTSVQGEIGRSATILVVDDTLTMRGLLTESLSTLGYICLSARDGREALQVLAQVGQVDAVFTDLEMPVMNGFEFLQECRKHHSKAKLPIVVLSSRNGEKHRKLAAHLGANAYLTKPFLEHQLTQILTQCAVEPYIQNP